MRQQASTEKFDGKKRVQFIRDKYAGQKTGSGHTIRVSIGDHEATLWYLYVGEADGVIGHHHMGIATVRGSDGRTEVGWFRGTETVPHQTDSFTTIADAIAAIDNAIAAIHNEPTQR